MRRPLIFRSRRSISTGFDSISILIRLAASSIRSIALSGSERSEMYRSDNTAAATQASSVMWMPWWASYFSLIPRRIWMVDSTLGCSTSTGWKRRSSALSFSRCFRYSSSVVAPIARSLPRARAGFSMLPASMLPSVFPAPTSVCSSSMNRITLPAAFSISVSSAFSRSSNSPRYFAPASSAGRSSASTCLPCSDSGTSPVAIRCAIPSTIAVLPTPGSPISTGLFLVRRCSTWIARRISSSRPITGSSLPRRARSVRSRVYFLSASRWPSASAESTFWPPRTASIAPSRALRVKPQSFTSAATGSLLSVTASRNISLAMNWSPRLLASFSVACSRLPRSRPACTCSPPCTWGSLPSSASSALCSFWVLTPARVSKALGPSAWASIALSTCTGSM